MRHSLILGLVLMSWYLYLLSLFFPAALLPLDGATEIDEGTIWKNYEFGWEVLLRIMVPLYWIELSALGYFLVNLAFWFSPVAFWCRLQDFNFGSTMAEYRNLENANVNSWQADHLPLAFLILFWKIHYPPLITVSMIVSWFAPRFVIDVSVGYYLWSAAITLMGMSFLIPISDLEEAMPAAHD